jgi:hypothetical protein
LRNIVLKQTGAMLEQGIACLVALTSKVQQEKNLLMNFGDYNL